MNSTPPPFGVAPENEDFSHPWLISGVISAICFGVGFALLYTTRIWANFWQWADWPFLFYCAILTPVLLGFYAYGVYRLVLALFKGREKT
jgi:hypothetical protein